MNTAPGKKNGRQLNAFRHLIRGELAAFDDEAKDLILEAMQIGCLARISSKGHCILHNNAGGSASVPRNMTSPNRTAQNARADMRRLMADHHRGAERSASSRTPSQPQPITLSQAFIEHGAAFSRWFDHLPESLPADQLLEVSFDETGQPVFAVIEVLAGAPPASNHLNITPEPEQEAEPHMPAKAQPIKTPAAAAEDPEEILQRVRVALGQDPRVTELENRVAEIEAKLEQEKQRADEAQTRLKLVQEAISA